MHFELKKLYLEMVTFLIIFMQRIIVPADVVGKLGKAQT